MSVRIRALPDQGCAELSEIIDREVAAPQLIDALARPEYRGYDSSGVATLENGKLTRRSAEGKLKNLGAGLSASRSKARSASDIPAGRLMAGRPRTTPIRMPPEKVAVRDLKHGPIALVDENMPVIVIAPHDEVFEKDVFEHAGSRPPAAGGSS